MRATKSGSICAGTAASRSDLRSVCFPTASRSLGLSHEVMPMKLFRVCSVGFCGLPPHPPIVD